MTFIDWDPLVRAAVFGGAFLVALFATLWVWYDSSGRQDEARWLWRGTLSALVLPTIPAVVAGAANLDVGDETLLNVLAWIALGSTVATLVVVAVYGLVGRVAPQPVFSGATFPGQGQRTFDATVADAPLTIPAPRSPARPVTQRPAEAYLFVKGGPDKGKQFPIHDVLTIGRGTHCSVALDDRRASSEHAQVKMNGGGCVFTDLGSTNGSFLIVEGREEQIRGSQPLVDGDELRIGHTLIEFVSTARDRRR
jgi:FHA domain